MMMNDDTEADLNAAIAGFRGVIRAAKTTMENADFYERNVAFLKKRIADASRELEQLVYAHDHGDEVIADAERAIRDLQRRLKLCKNRAKIVELVKLSARASALAREVTRCEARLYHGDSEWSQCENDHEVTLDAVPPGRREKEPMRLCAECAARVEHRAPGDQPWWYKKR